MARTTATQASEVDTAQPTRGRAGRKRDPARDAVILDATLAVLAEQGFDRMTIDLVAARAGMARATVYRRWPTKVELVIDAVTHLSREDVGDVGDVDAGRLPDTGTLRGDMVAMIRPFDDEQQQVRIQVVTSLLALVHLDERLADAATGAGLGPWIDVNRALIRRAVDRREFPAPADLDLLAQLIPTMCLARAAQHLPITYEFSVALIDGVVIPALRGGT